LAWIIPHQRGALAFTETEVAFLFPAPVSRRGLIHYKLLRSQTAILFTTLFLVLVTNRFGGHSWIRAAGWWLLLCTLNLHFIGSSFARTMLLERGISNWQRRLVTFLVLLGLGAWVVIWAGRTMPGRFPIDQLTNLADLEPLRQYLQQILTSGPMPYLLLPFRWVVRPYLAHDALTFLKALGPALLLMALHYWWVIRADVAFEEASVDASKRLAERVAALRAGNFRGRKTTFKRKRPPFELRPGGWPAIGLLWKNLISAGQAFTLRVWVVLAAMGFAIAAILRGTAAGSGFIPVVAMIALMLMVWLLLLGPQFLRQDFRQDLAQADLLKSYPLPGWQIALGELLAPATIMTGIELLLLGIGVALSAELPGNLRLNLGMRLNIGLGVACMLPMLNMLTLQIPNAAVLLLPAWFQAGKDSPQGIEATGQRLIFLLGSFIVFFLALIPATVGFAAVFVGVNMVLSQPIAFLAASLVAAAVLAIEVGLGVMLLGWLFERFDVSDSQA
ncbi:MAG TPA: putative ABC exporter domain-containing protein, partial [Candidatus Dormibacteraeota bacterium]|nr:putative ABC exporter domain-containing protein [Candidatus Dormibacteraeota bacterium]